MASFNAVYVAPDQFAVAGRDVSKQFTVARPVRLFYGAEGTKIVDVVATTYEREQLRTLVTVFGELVGENVKAVATDISSSGMPQMGAPLVWKINALEKEQP